jgi:hypothetical protein
MSRWPDRSWEERREEQRKFEADVFYDAWRRGLDPDRAVGCARDCHDDGRTPEECVDGFAARERQRREARRQMEEPEPQDSEPSDGG